MPWFGPPECFTIPSTCPWLAHLVSGLVHEIIALIGLAFATAPAETALTYPIQLTRWLILQKARGHLASEAPTP